MRHPFLILEQILICYYICVLSLRFRYVMLLRIMRTEMFRASSLLLSAFFVCEKMGYFFLEFVSILGPLCSRNLSGQSILVNCKILFWDLIHVPLGRENQQVVFTGVQKYTSCPVVGDWRGWTLKVQLKIAKKVCYQDWNLWAGFGR